MTDAMELEAQLPDHKLPPGFRFYPSDEELIRCYLTQKIMSFWKSPFVADPGLEPLGSGGYGTVYRGILRQLPTLPSIECIAPLHLAPKSDADRLLSRGAKFPVALSSIRGIDTKISSIIMHAPEYFSKDRNQFHSSSCPKVFIAIQCIHLVSTVLCILLESRVLCKLLGRGYAHNSLMTHFDIFFWVTTIRWELLHSSRLYSGETHHFPGYITFTFWLIPRILACQRVPYYFGVVILLYVRLFIIVSMNVTLPSAAPLPEQRVLSNGGQERINNLRTNGTPATASSPLKDAQELGGTEPKHDSGCDDPCVTGPAKNKTSATWVISSAAVHHATGDASLLSDFTPEHDLSVQLADGASLLVCGRGCVVTDTMVLPDVWFVPGLTENLVSAGQLTELDYCVGFGRGVCYITSATGAIVGKAHVGGDGLFELDFLKVEGYM